MGLNHGGNKEILSLPAGPCCCHACAHLGREELRDQGLPGKNVKVSGNAPNVSFG